MSAGNHRISLAATDLVRLMANRTLPIRSMAGAPRRLMARRCMRWRTGQGRLDRRQIKLEVISRAEYLRRIFHIILFFCYHAKTVRSALAHTYFVESLRKNRSPLTKSVKSFSHLVKTRRQAGFSQRYMYHHMHFTLGGDELLLSPWAPRRP